MHRYQIRFLPLLGGALTINILIAIYLSLVKYNSLAVESVAEALGVVAAWVVQAAAERTARGNFVVKGLVTLIYVCT